MYKIEQNKDMTLRLEANISDILAVLEQAKEDVTRKILVAAGWTPPATEKTKEQLHQALNGLDANWQPIPANVLDAIQLILQYQAHGSITMDGKSLLEPYGMYIKC